MSRGSSAVFCIAGMVFDTAADVELAAGTLRRLRLALHLRAGHEFHFNNEPPHIREAFMRAACELPFGAYAIVLDKARCAADAGRVTPLLVCERMCLALLSRCLEQREDAVVVIDGRVRTELRVAIRQQMNVGCRRVAKVKARDSARDPMLQLADMVCGAVARCYRGERHRDDSYFRLLGARMRSIQVLEELPDAIGGRS